jgi:hypothetical protein
MGFTLGQITDEATGTWQRSDGAEKAPPSNVTRLSRAIKSYSKHDKVQQIVYYMRGVGTSGKLDKVLGGEFPASIAANKQNSHLPVLIGEL